MLRLRAIRGGESQPPGTEPIAAASADATCGPASGNDVVEEVPDAAVVGAEVADDAAVGSEDGVVVSATDRPFSVNATVPSGPRRYARNSAAASSNVGLTHPAESGTGYTSSPTVAPPGLIPIKPGVEAENSARSEATTGTAVKSLFPAASWV